jgi:hypothetical protein
VHKLEVKGKERRNISEANTAYHRKEIYLHANPLANVLGLHMTKGFYNQK